MMMTSNLPPLLKERSIPGSSGYKLPALDVPEKPLEAIIPQQFLRDQAANLPELSEGEVVRHYTNLARLNHGVDVGFYPLGSCTMKYNPRVNEDMATLPGLSRIHPLQPESTVQGALQIMYELGNFLAEIAGLDATALQPAAGAHGELTGLLIIRAYHRSKHQEGQRTEIIVPDSAHGTNPASAMMAGFKVREVPSDSRGGIDVAALREAVGPQTAGLMLTNPNTLGLFDENIALIADIVHEAGGLLYYDGANANAILGVVRPGDMGFDIVHFNLHKTFSTPHGGGGPGAGPIVVSSDLAGFLPYPRVGFDSRNYYFFQPENSIGRIGSFYGNFAVMVRAYTYILMHGAVGLRQVSEAAVVNANYLMRQLQDVFELPFDRHCMHEFVLSGKGQKEFGVRTMDIAKRMLDYGIHAPTVYFPLVVEEALMIEPTETESKETLDRFVAVMKEIAAQVREDPEVIKDAPHHTPVRRLDEAQAARNPILHW